MKNNEILIKEIVDLFDSYNYDVNYISNVKLNNDKNSFNVNDYNKICLDLIKLFNPEFNKTLPLIPVANYSVKPQRKSCNDDITNKEGYSLTFMQYYPTIINNVLKDKFNIVEYNEIYKFLCENYSEIKDFSFASKRIWKTMINGAFGYSMYKTDAKVKLLDSNEVVEFNNTLFKEIIENFDDSIYCYRVDEILIKDNDAAIKIKDFIEIKYPFLRTEINSCVFQQRPGKGNFVGKFK